MTFKQGWTRPTPTAKMHFFESGTSLCGKYRDVPAVILYRTVNELETCGNCLYDVRLRWPIQ